MKNALKKVKGTLKKGLDHYGSIIMSIIPCIIVASLLGAVINLLSEMPLAGGGLTLVEAHPGLAKWCDILQVINGCGIYMLPVYVAWATVRHMRGTELYGIFAGLVMVPASLMNGLDLSAAVLEGTAQYWDFGLFLVPQAGFQGQMFIAIIAGVVLVYLERLFNKLVPQVIRIIIVPVVCITLTGLFTYLVAGPAARWLESALTGLFNYLLEEPSLKYVSGFILGAATLPMMIFGLHLAFVSINLQQVMTEAGSPIWPITVVSVLAAGAAALAALIFSKNKSLKEGAREGTIVTLGLGSVEPALFGVCMKNKYAMASAVLAAGVAGLLCRIFGCSAYSFGLNGFLSFLNLPLDQWGRYALAIGASIGMSFLMTSLLLTISERRGTDRRG